jgi:membrane-associated phospholipid phosphatase
MNRNDSRMTRPPHDNVMVSMLTAYIVFARCAVTLPILLLPALRCWLGRLDAATDRCADPGRELGVARAGYRGVWMLSFISIFLAALSYLFLDVRTALAARAFADRHHDLAQFMADLAHGNVVFTLAGLALLWAFLRHHQRLAYYAILALASIAAAGLFVNVLKFIFGRYRPKALIENHFTGFMWLQHDYLYESFPSGHAANAFALATALCLAWPRLTPLWIILGAVAAAGRIISVSHYPSDVLVGGLLAVLVTLLLHRLLKVRLPRLVPWLRDPA